MHIGLVLKTVDDKCGISLGGLIFRNAHLVEVLIDNESIYELDFFEGGLLYFDELKKSMLKSGNYLLFTSVSGVADDAGWDYVKVKHIKDEIIWFICRDSVEKNYHFSKEEYTKTISNFEKDLKLVEGLTLEPKFVVFPEILEELCDDESETGSKA